MTQRQQQILKSLQKASSFTISSGSGYTISGGTISKTCGDSDFTLQTTRHLSSNDVTFFSSNTSVASVDVNGKVTILKSGKATSPSDDQYNQATAQVTVQVARMNQTGFEFPDETIIKTYGNANFTVSASGGQGSGDATYESSDVNVATVTNGGVVTIKKAGTVTITAKKASDSIYNETVDTVTINIGKAASSIKTVPAASDIAVIGKLSSAALKGGEGNVVGTFDWTNPDTVVSKDGEYEVTFTPASPNYSSCTCKVPVKMTPVITNSSTGVQYDLTSANLPSGVTSVSVHSSAVSNAGSEGAAYSVVNNLINSRTSSTSPSAVKLYNLSLIDQSNQAVTGFTGKITVKIPIPSGMSGDLHVYWYNDTDGTVTDMNAKQENGYLVFDTTHFSFYAIAKLTAKSTSSSDTSSSYDTSPLDSSSKTTPNSNTGVIRFRLYR